MRRPRANPGVQAALGFRAHSGWAVVVAVAGAGKTLRVIERRRIELVDPTAAGTVQPYHTVRDWDLTRAETFLEEASRRSCSLASEALENVIDSVKHEGGQLGGCGLLVGSGRLPSTLGEILKSHPMIHTAEGEFFRNSLAHAAEECGLAVIRIKERDVITRAASDLQISADKLVARLKEIGRTLGPPWRQDEKLATLAAAVALAGSPG